VRAGRGEQQQGPAGHRPVLDAAGRVTAGPELIDQLPVVILDVHSDSLSDPR
jgi:hypothetical protein